MNAFRFALGLLAAFGAAAHANTHVSLDLRLGLNGKITPSRILTDFGKTASLSEVDSSDSGFEITVTPQAVDDGKNAIALNFVISEITKGQKQVVSEPHVTVLEGQEAVVQQRQDDRPTMELVVVPTLVEGERL